jgi:hypothetical protein
VLDEGQWQVVGSFEPVFMTISRKELVAGLEWFCSSQSDSIMEHHELTVLFFFGEGFVDEACVASSGIVGVYSN